MREIGDTSCLYPPEHSGPFNIRYSNRLNVVQLESLQIGDLKLDVQMDHAFMASSIFEPFFTTPSP